MPKLEYKRCPFCAHGNFFNVHTQKFTPCEYCNGAGAVARNIMCACSAPIKVFKDGFYYCGEETCLKDLIADKLGDNSTTRQGA